MAVCKISDQIIAVCIGDGHKCNNSWHDSLGTDTNTHPSQPVKNMMVPYSISDKKESETYQAQL